MSERVCQVRISLVLSLRHTHNKIKIDRQVSKIYIYLCSWHETCAMDVFLTRDDPATDVLLIFRMNDVLNHAPRLSEADVGRGLKSPSVGPLLGFGLLLLGLGLVPSIAPGLLD